jgi:dihydrolipoamide dehydrogenase
MINRKNEVIKLTVDGIRFLMNKNKIEVIHGHGTFKSKNSLSVKKDDGSIIELEFKRAIIATGSKPATLPFISIDKHRIITSTEALNLSEIPKHLIVIGGGVIGLELGSVYARLGSKVSVVEYANSIIPTMDGTMGKELTKVLKKLDFDFYVSHKVTGAQVKGNEVHVTAEDLKDGKSLNLVGDYCLVSVGRKPFTEQLGLETIGIKTDEKGKIPVNDHLETVVKGIYAIGDVINGPMLAHKAEEEGVFVAEVMAGQKPHINYNLIPAVVYTWPEVAGVGQTEEQLKNAGIKYKVGTFNYRALGRARASMDIDGLVKILADEQTDEILGAHIIGARAADMIMEAVVAMEYRASAEDIVRMSHPHPTYTEAFREACMDATAKRAIHS